MAATGRALPKFLTLLLLLLLLLLRHLLLHLRLLLHLLLQLRWHLLKLPSYDYSARTSSSRSAGIGTATILETGRQPSS